MTAAELPRVIFGTSALGNLYQDSGFEAKLGVVKEIIAHSEGVAVFDSAGKYGAGLALESLAKALDQLNVPPDAVMISNKLGWKRIALESDEPTFEPGAWVNLEHDAVQCISYEGILECFEQGEALLGRYSSQMVSVHDPDEYLAAASDAQDKTKRREDIIAAYQALHELKLAGRVKSIGVGSKDPEIIRWVSENVSLDWAMFACSLTPYVHGRSVRGLLDELAQQNVLVINSAVFHGGFLIGSEYFDYQKVNREEHAELFAWRDAFLEECKRFGVDAAAACVQFSFHFPAVAAVALNTSSPKRVAYNMSIAEQDIPSTFWQGLSERKLIDLS